MRRALLLVLLWTGSLGSVHADGGGAAEAWGAARAEAARRLASIATEAHAAKLFGSRNETCERILAFDPDHEKARRWLKYGRRSGTWVRDRYDPPRNRGSKAALAEHGQALASWGGWWRGRLLEVHAQAVEAGDASTANVVLTEALERHADDPVFRELAGQVPLGAGQDLRWVLVDTRAGLANRARFLEAARRAARAVRPPKPGHLEDVDRGGDHPWPRVLQGETVRVIGAVAAEELDRHHEIAEAAATVCSTVFGVEASVPKVEGRYGRGYPLYVARNRMSGNAFLRDEPGISERDMLFLGRLLLSWFPSRLGVLIKADTRVLRWEATCHGMCGRMLVPHLGFGGSSRGAWVQEAVGLYLTWLQVRTRLIYTAVDVKGRYGHQRPGVPTWTRRLGDQTVDWHALAAEAIRAVSDAEIHLVAGKDFNQLTTRDLLAGYGIAVYVLEVHPDLSAAFCRDVATQKEVSLDAVLTKHLQTDFVTLRPHLLRWLDEMASHAPPPGDPR